MGWNPEKDLHRKGNRNPESKPEHPPKGPNPSAETLKRLGKTAVNGPGKK